VEAVFKTFASNVALLSELLAILLLAAGAIDVAWSLVTRLSEWSDLERLKRIWLRFAARLILALELTLAADIVRTAIAPTWNEIGQLAAIATIRTLLNLFLERDIRSERQEVVVRNAAPTPEPDQAGGAPISRN
jgi:uncharacterized membrane protein